MPGHKPKWCTFDPTTATMTVKTIHDNNDPTDNTTEGDVSKEVVIPKITTLTRLAEKGGDLLSFTVIGKDKTEGTFKANSKEDFHMWVDAIRIAIAKKSSGLKKTSSPLELSGETIIDHRTQLSFKASVVPLEHLKCFQFLEGCVIYWFALVKKNSHGVKIDDRVVAIGDTHLYVFKPNGTYTRCMDISQINTLYENSLTTEDGYHIGIRMNPPEYDLEFSCSHEQRTEFVRCVQAVWRYVTGRTHHGQIIPMVTKSFAHEVVKECVLKKPAGWTLNITAPTSQKTFRLKLQKFNQQQQQQQLNAASITSPPTSPPLQDPTTASFSSATTKTIELDPSSPTQKPQQPQQVQSPSSPASPDSSPRGRTGPPTFVRGTQIAKGGFGVVYQAINFVTQEHVAVKEIPIEAGSSSSSSLQEIKKEFHYLCKLRHPNVVSVYHFEIKGPKAYIYMELMPMGSVSTIIRSFKRLHENTARKYITHALAALAYLH
eukprot:PhF_6_TR10840/c1_g1_i5/m.17518